MKISHSIIPGLLALSMACTAYAWGPHTIEIQNTGTNQVANDKLTLIISEN